MFVVETINEDLSIAIIFTLIPCKCTLMEKEQYSFMSVHVSLCYLFLVCLNNLLFVMIDFTSWRYSLTFQ